MPTLMDIIGRATPPVPWAEGDNIPWNEPGFSQRMLREHLSQEHDAASRRYETIDRQVEWIDSVLLPRQPGRVLDLGCGPGLYTERLAQRGHTCRGIDFSPASIEYARQRAALASLPCTYLCQDVRQADFNTGYDLVMFIYGEPNVFKPVEMRMILQKAWQALVTGGKLLLEVHSYDLIYQMSHQPPSWYSQSTGLFSDHPYLLLKEHFWEADQHVTTERYFVLDAVTNAVTRFAASYQAYSDNEYRALLSEAGFYGLQMFSALGGVDTDGMSGLVALIAHK